MPNRYLPQLAAFVGLFLMGALIITLGGETGPLMSQRIWETFAPLPVEAAGTTPQQPGRERVPAGLMLKPSCKMHLNRH